MFYQIYTDGACSGNPGPGGYAFMILGPETDLKVSGHRDKATNNQMELMAIVRALAHLKQMVCSARKNVSVDIYSDSAYCVNAVEEGWLYIWQKNNWKTKNGHDVKNVELWIELYNFLKKTHIEVRFVKVKGHSGNKYNELVDKAAKEAITRNLNAKSTK